jgi:hypothetical protein
MLDNHTGKVLAAEFLIKVCVVVVMIITGCMPIAISSSGRFVVEDTSYNKLPTLTSTARRGGGADCKVVAQVRGA